MGLETGTGIGDLVPTNPLSTDAVSAGDDHIRLIKTVMQSITFLKSIQTFTASGTWTRPTNVKKVIVYCQGAGGGGGGGSVAGYSGGGGSSGAIAIKWLDVTAIASATVTIGAGGTAGAAAGGTGGDGASTSFISAGPLTHCLAREGRAGTSAPFPGLVHDRSLSVGDIVFAGTFGDYGGPPFAGGQVFGARGGAAGGASDLNALPNSGGGGGGGFSAPGGSGTGGTGGSGYLIVLEFGW